MRTRQVVGISILWLRLSIYPIALGQSAPTNRTDIPRSGSTVLRVTSPKGEARVTIQTAMIEGNCQKTSPTTGFLSESGTTDASVVRSMSISVAGEPIAVPPFVYSGLLNVRWASVMYRNGNFDLSINEGADEYLLHVYFNVRNGIVRMTVYDYVAATLVEDAKLYQAVLE